MWFNEKRVFITGTDTGVGKTYVSIKILQMFQENGLKPCYFKPISTGGIFHQNKLVSEDVLNVRKKTGIQESEELMNPLLYSIPAAPVISAELEGKPVQLNKIRQAYKSLCEHYESIVVEGIGGIMVPLTENYLVIDLVKEFNLPVIVVARAKLGTLNHTALTIRVLKDFGIKISGIVISHSSQMDLELGEDASIAVMERITGIPVIKRFFYEMDYA
ncbi:MAG: dethiobiotin synthase [Candidatus Aureabacteria bacterium]|nr:dethiobiotin synthase [Candidatus Auribacterota bacterium]